MPSAPSGYSLIPFPAGRSGHVRPESGRCRDEAAPAGQLLGADDIGVARVRRERLQPLAGGRCCWLIRTCFIGNPFCLVRRPSANVSSLPRRRRVTGHDSRDGRAMSYLAGEVAADAPPLTVRAGAGPVFLGERPGLEVGEAVLAHARRSTAAS
jgi:hypothetical protein